MPLCRGRPPQSANPAPAQRSSAKPAPAQQTSANPAPARQTTANPAPAQQSSANTAPDDAGRRLRGSQVTAPAQQPEAKTGESEGVPQDARLWDSFSEFPGDENSSLLTESYAMLHADLKDEESVSMTSTLERPS